MNCHECQDAILDLARDVATGDETREAQAHLDTCSTCRSRLARERQLTADFRALAQATSSERPSSRLEHDLAQGFRSHHPSWSPARQASFEVRRWLPLAAAVAIAVGSVAWWSLTNHGDKGETRTPKPVAATTPVPRAGAPQPVVERDKPEGTNARTGAPDARPKTAARRRVQMVRPAGFVPLPAAATLPVFESGKIVRVAIPVSQLPAYGLDIPLDVGDVSIEADLLIGQDGQPRAIRLVTADAQDSRSRR